MSILIAGTVRVPPEKLESLKPHMLAMLEASRAEDGCFDYSYADDILDSGLIHVTELWRDQPALDRHFASNHIAQWRAEWPRLGIGDRNLKVYDVGEARPI